MSLNTVQPAHAPLASTSTVRGSGSVSPDGGLHGPTDTVRLSDRGLLMSRLAEQSPPTRENVRNLSAALADDLKRLIRQSAAPTRRDIGFEVDQHTGEVSIRGESDDSRALAALIDGQPEVGRKIQDIASLGRLLAASEREADLCAASRAAQSAARIGAVVDDYAARTGQRSDAPDFSSITGHHPRSPAESGRILETYAAVSGASGMAAKISLIFDGRDVQVLANGRSWI